MSADDDDPGLAELGHRISDADRPSKPMEKRLRLQWNVPLGTTPYIPLWFALTTIGLFVVVLLWDLVIR